MQDSGGLKIKDYSVYTNEELVALYKEDPTDQELLDYIGYHFHYLLSRRIADLFLYGADKQDLIQEGSVGLLKALNDYNPEKNDNFEAFASLCIRRAQMNAINSYKSKKHDPLNESISLDKEEEAESVERRLAETKVSDPEEITLDYMETSELLDRISRELSPLELNVVQYTIEGYDYRQIAAFLGKDAKSIDNALQRIKKKVKRILERD